jgi:hypothetical protein
VSYLRQTALLVLSKIAKNLFSFPLFYPSFHVPDSDVSEQFLPIFPTPVLVNIAQIQKNTILLTLALVIIFTQKMNLKKKFSMPFFLFILYFY